LFNAGLRWRRVPEDGFEPFDVRGDRHAARHLEGAVPHAFALTRFLE
jgi:hypothetical protein